MYSIIIFDMHEVIIGQLHASATLPPVEIGQYPLDLRIGGTQNRSKCFGIERNGLNVPGMEFRTSRAYMPSFGILRCMTLVRTDISEERSASIIMLIRIGELGMIAVEIFLRSLLRLLVAADVVPSMSILVTLMMEAICSSETSVLTRA
jgi:hypothetical protein